MSFSHPNPSTILLVDDNDEGAMLSREALKRVRPEVVLQHAQNGAEGLAYLRREGAYARVESPAFVLIDLNMPVMNGQEFLREIAQDDRLQHLPVVVWSSSYDADQVRTMYRLGCAGYAPKPFDFDGFKTLFQSLANYWLDTVRLPEVE